ADIHSDSRRLSVTEAISETSAAGTLFVWLAGLADPDGFAALHKALMTSDTPVTDGAAAARLVLSILAREAGTEVDNRPRLRLVGQYVDFMTRKRNLAHLVNDLSLAAFR